MDKLKDQNLSPKEDLWLNRLKQFVLDYNVEQDYVCSWWLRVEYKQENLTTAKINYVLKKLVAKGILEMVTTRYYTKFKII